MSNDVRVAEILGWEWTDVHGVKQLYAPLWYWRSNKSQFILPSFTTDPAADYLVLEWVRSQNSESMRDEYSALLGHYWIGDCAGYKPGDYSRALLELDKKGLLK